MEHCLFHGCDFLEEQGCPLCKQYELAQQDEMALQAARDRVVVAAKEWFNAPDGTPADLELIEAIGDLEELENKS